MCICNSSRLLCRGFLCQDLPGAEFLWCPLFWGLFVPCEQDFDQSLSPKVTDLSREKWGGGKTVLGGSTYFEQQR